MSASQSTPYLILITGFPGSGKTSLGKALSSQLAVPLYSKDAFKEIVFDTLGASDQAWSRQVSGTAHRIMDHICQQELSAGNSLILESNFKPEFDSLRFQIIQAKYGCTLVQILCWADGNVLADRFLARQHSAERHAGHTIEISDEQVRADLAPGKDQPLELGNALLLEFDSTDLAGIDYKPLFQRLSSIIL